jgi:hypothetical protein
MAYYWSSTSSKSSSIATSSSEASFVALIICMWCIILGSLIILWLCIIVMRLCIIIRWRLKLVHYYIVVFLETVVRYCTVVVLQIVARYYIVVVVHIVLSCVHPAPYMYLKSSPSLSPNFYSPCLHSLLTCKSYKMCSLALSDIYASLDNDKDHVCVFYISHTMVLLKIRGLLYPLIYTTQIMETHSYDDLLSCIMYTRHLLSSPYLYSDLIEMSNSSDLVSALPHLDLYIFTDFLLTVMLLAEPHPGSRIYSSLKDSSSVAIKNSQKNAYVAYQW